MCTANGQRRSTELTQKCSSQNMYVALHTNVQKALNTTHSDLPKFLRFVVPDFNMKIFNKIFLSEPLFSLLALHKCGEKFNLLNQLYKSSQNQKPGFVKIRTLCKIQIFPKFQSFRTIYIIWLSVTGNCTSSTCVLKTFKQTYCCLFTIDCRLRVSLYYCALSHHCSDTLRAVDKVEGELMFFESLKFWFFS